MVSADKAKVVLVVGEQYCPSSPRTEGDENIIEQ